MTIKVGTIQDMTGEGYEILVDEETRSILLAKFFCGNMMSETVETIDCNEPTKVL